MQISRITLHGTDLMLLEFGQATSFLLVAVLITLAPGPDNLMVLGLGLSRGRHDGMVFGLGCGLGCICHTTLAALGVSAAIAASVTLFTALKIAGGLYLLWLGIQSLTCRRDITSPVSAHGGQGTSSTRTIFIKGLLANAINPKVILFFLAFLPQFVDASRGGSAVQILELGLLFTVQAAILFATIGWFSGRLGHRLANTPKVATWLNRLTGGIFIALGARLIVVR